MYKILNFNNSRELERYLNREHISKEDIINIFWIDSRECFRLIYLTHEEHEQ